MTATHYVSVKFESSAKATFFATDLSDLKVGEKVVAESAHGIQVGTVALKPRPLDPARMPADLPPVQRRADREDIAEYEENRGLAVTALEVAKRAIQELELGMRPLKAEFALDGSKLTIIYTADGRVDFRDLLRILASRFRCRIELRQIGSRDKARLIGGLGICGRPLCCSSYLNVIPGVSINRAKNQMLALNIPKLSGQCDKLVCCLLYEDDNYTELKKGFPKIGTFFDMSGTHYRIASYNLFSRQVKLESDGNASYMRLEDIAPFLKKGGNVEKPKLQGRR